MLRVQSYAAQTSTFSGVRSISKLYLAAPWFEAQLNTPARAPEVGTPITRKRVRQSSLVRMRWRLGSLGKRRSSSLWFFSSRRKSSISWVILASNSSSVRLSLRSTNLYGFGRGASGTVAVYLFMNDLPLKSDGGCRVTRSALKKCAAGITGGSEDVDGAALGAAISCTCCGS